MQNRYKQSFKRADAKNLELSVYNCGLESCEPGHTWGPGIRDHYLIHLVTRGSGSYTLGGHRYELKAGDVFFARPSRLITYSADREDPWEYYWVGFNGASAARMAKDLPLSEEQPVWHCPDVPATRELLHNIWLARGPKPADETAMTGHLYLFLANLMQHRKPDAPARPDNAGQYVKDAIKYIQFNYSHNIGVDDIAKAVGISRSHLYRVFLKHVGQSPIDYLTEFRIQEACSLLENTSLSIAEIAYSTGFFDQFYFSRVFKKLKGVAPSKYLAGQHQT